MPSACVPSLQFSLQLLQHDQLLKGRSARADAPTVIKLHRLHGNGTFVVNADLIELVEACPDTVVTLVNRHRYLVEESLEQVLELVVSYRARITAAVGASDDTAVAARALASFEDGQERAA